MSLVLSDVSLRKAVDIPTDNENETDGKQAQEPNIGTEQLFPGHDILLVNQQV
jgi:hypothetical protein